MNNDSFTIMTFNIRFGLAHDTDNPWGKRKDFLLETIKSESPDFIGFQEANDFQRDFLKKNLKNYNCTGIYKTSEKRWQDIPIFFKKEWECVLSDHFFLSNSPLVKSKFKESEWPRQAVTSLFYKQGKFICITNTHFDFKDLVQQKSAKLIKSRLDSYNTRVPQIICGDFNADPTGVCYYEFTQSNNLESFKDPFGNLHTPTFHGFTGVPKTGRIDWVLYKGDIKPIGKKILKNSKYGKYPSDHFPVSVKFQFNT